MSQWIAQHHFERGIIFKKITRDWNPENHLILIISMTLGDNPKGFRAFLAGTHCKYQCLKIFAPNSPHSDPFWTLDPAKLLRTGHCELDQNHSNLGEQKWMTLETCCNKVYMKCPLNLGWWKMFEVYYFTLYKIEIYRYIRQQVFIKIQDPQKMFDSTTFLLRHFRTWQRKL